MTKKIPKNKIYYQVQTFIIIFYLKAIHEIIDTERTPTFCDRKVAP